MIFVTVGTHEQAFDRLLKKMDELKESGKLKDDVFIQTGYSDYTPRFCEYKNMIGFDEMYHMTSEADIVITHGGPGSIMLPMSMNKKPIVVPRQHKFGEHVDDHQVLFSKRLEEENKILAVIDIEDIEEYIFNYDKYKGNNVALDSNLPSFIKRLDEITDSLMNNI
ncbi:glycosyltransferase [Cytobacillus oceanisediminis]|uniref:glycosyltransferase n=1 Tax=Cytobacillus oceanisediminis TaxID=665099 RepID=UPI0011A91DF3|nr:glycosyltransferase [Cytobacillus oceanisediminis]